MTKSILIKHKEGLTNTKHKQDYFNMIKPNEVRIGNLVGYEGRIFKIHCISEELPSLDTIEFGIGVVEWKDLNPVPLTIEVLRDFGFSDTEYKEGYIGIDVGNTDFTLTKPNHESESVTEKYFTFHCKYGGWPRYKAFENTHDLQNFFFALNGQELTIKDN